MVVTSSWSKLCLAAPTAAATAVRTSLPPLATGCSLRWIVSSIWLNCVLCAPPRTPQVSFRTKLVTKGRHVDLGRPPREEEGAHPNCRIRPTPASIWPCMKPPPSAAAAVDPPAISSPITRCRSVPAPSWL